METKLYQVKPLKVEAIQLTPYNYAEIAEWVGGAWKIVTTRPHNIEVVVPNVNGNQKGHLKIKAKDVAFDIDYAELDQHLGYGTFADFKQHNLFESEGDFILKHNNRYSVIKAAEFYKVYEPVSES